MRLFLDRTPEENVILYKSRRGTELKGRAAFRRFGVLSPSCFRVGAAFHLILLFIAVAAAFPAHGREIDVLQDAVRLVVNRPATEPEVLHVVERVAQNTFILGTQEYNKDVHI